MHSFCRMIRICLHKPRIISCFNGLNKNLKKRPDFWINEQIEKILWKVFHLFQAQETSFSLKILIDALENSLYKHKYGQFSLHLEAGCSCQNADWSKWLSFSQKCISWTLARWISFWTRSSNFLTIEKGNKPFATYW